MFYYYSFWFIKWAHISVTGNLWLQKINSVKKIYKDGVFSIVHLKHMAWNIVYSLGVLTFSISLSIRTQCWLRVVIHLRHHLGGVKGGCSISFYCYHQMLNLRCCLKFKEQIVLFKASQKKSDKHMK